MSAATRAAVFCACAARWAFSSRQTCHGPGKYVERPASSSRAASVTASRNQRSWATIMQAASRSRQLALEPLEARHIEVVRWLVEQDQIGVTGQCARERRPRQLPAREGCEPPVEVLVAKAQSPGDRARVVAPGVAAGVLEPCLGARVGGERRLVGRALRHRLLQARQFPLGGKQVGGAGEDVLAEAQVALDRRPLVVQRDACSLLDDELAALDARLAREHAQQCRLAGAVRSRERQPVTALELERHPVEEQVARELLAQVGGDHDGHARMVARPCMAPRLPG